MRYWTYEEIKNKVEKDIGIEQEEFIVASELLGYCNEAIDEAESEIHDLYEDYFLTYMNVNMVEGTENYALPTDIYADKIRGILHKDNNLIYPVDRIRFSNKFEDIMDSKVNNPSGRYRYFLLNRSASEGIQLEIVPSPRTSITNGLKMWYIRNANRMVNDSDLCDIPEFVGFVLQYMKTMVYEKEGHPNAPSAIAKLEKLRVRMTSSLRNKVIDGDTEIEKDLDIYEEMV